MRIDRLLAITTYLLNRDMVTGKTLAEKFEVSERTIQRDIEVINMAGIPILSVKGVGGGYKIMDTFKVIKQPTTDKDINNILMALKGLGTALVDEGVNQTIEKIRSIPSKDEYKEDVSVDFSIIHENPSIGAYLKILSEAILRKKVVVMTYMNANQNISKREIEPVMLKYKWYTWYLVAYCIERHAYRIFKLARIQEIEMIDQEYKSIHVADDQLFDELMDKDNRKSIHIKFLCNKKVKCVIKEYIPNCIFYEKEEERFIGEMDVPENERFWYAIILSLGDEVTILEPDSLKMRLYEHGKKMINLYKSDT